MGSVRLDGEDESKPSAADGKKYKLPKKLLDDCGAVSHASVPRKLRSDIKKRGRESIIPPLPISRKKLRASNGVERTLRENGAKKFRQKMKQKGHITKDEKEVAETLYSLADMFSNIAKTKDKKPVLEGELTKTKYSTKVESGSSSKNAAEDAAILRPQESRKMNTKVALEAVLVNSTAELVKTGTSDNAKQSESPFGEQSPSTSASRVQSNLSPGLRSKMSTPDVIESCERTIALEQVDSRIPKYGKHLYPKEDKFKGVFRSPSLSSTGVLSSETQRSCLRSAAWFENTNAATPPSVIENGVTTNKIHYPRVVLEPEKPKSCSAHVSIARLIKSMQKSKSKKGLLHKPTQLTTSGGVEQGPYLSIDNQKRIINGANGVLPFNGFIHSVSDKDSADSQIAFLSYKRLLLEQQHASKTSATCSSQKQGSDYLSLGAGGCSSDASEGINRAGYNFEALKQNHFTYRQPQNHSTMLFSQPQNGYSSAFHGRTSAAAASQVQLSPYLGNTAGSSIIVPPGDQLDSFQQKWTAQLSSQYNSPSLENYAQAFSPHFHSAVGSKYQHFSPPQQLLTLSNLERHYGRLNFELDRNGAALYPDNMTQLQLLCNQRL